MGWCYIKSVILNIRCCGIPFDVWAKKDEDCRKGSYSFTSLVGYRKKSEIFSCENSICHPSNGVKQVVQLWTVSSINYYIMQLGDTIVKGFQRPLWFNITKKFTESIQRTTPIGNRL